MTALWKKLSDEVSAPFLSALLLCAGFWGFVAWDQSHWWRTKADYSFGWIVPVFVVFVIHDRWPKIVAAATACAAAGSPRAMGWRAAVLWLGVAASLTGGAGLFLLGAFYRAAAGASHPGSLAIALGTAGILLPVLLLSSPQPGAAEAAPGAGLFDDARVR
ncbi:MAG: archaeosortase/exosortase family protein, partial [Verrucomicrobia bacterium]|nr:archaeosortase/exosortase family protein [Verrucomicrobiota bacterium]